MLTALFYTFILISSTFLVWLSEKGRTRWDKITLSGIAFLLVFIPSAIRYGIGTDYFSYIHIYENPEAHTQIEKGFSFLNIFLRSLSLPPEAGIAFYSFLFTLIAFLAYPKKNKWLVHLLFFSSVMLFSYSGIRQAIAIAFMLYAVKEWLWGSCIKSLIIIAFGATFHYSATLYFPILVSSLIPLSDRFKSYIFPYVVLGLTLLAFFTPTILESINFILIHFDIRYANYIGGQFYRKTELGTGLGVILHVTFSLAFIYLTPHLIKKDNKNWGLIVLAAFYILSKALSTKIHIFNRASDILIIAPILMPYVLFSYKTNSYFEIKKTVAILFSVMTLLIFLKSSLEPPGSDGGIGVTPYTSIFNKSLQQL